ncbi:S9 family peptidase, partial [Streptomyces sp. UH6]|nr:S9 family peptidase [Streptomyces sp. UH6]
MLPPAAPSPSPDRPTAHAVRRVREAMLRLVHPAEARVSPDGATVAVTAMGPDHTRIVLTPATERPSAGDVSLAADDGTTWRHTPRWLP